MCSARGGREEGTLAAGEVEVCEQGAVAAEEADDLVVADEGSSRTGQVSAHPQCRTLGSEGPAAGNACGAKDGRKGR